MTSRRSPKRASRARTARRIGALPDSNRTAKFYALTRKGRRTAQAELDSWLRLSGAVARVLRALEQGA